MESNSTGEIQFPGFFSTVPAVEAPPATKLICLTTVYGDTLSGISALFGGSVEELARLNGIENPDLIFPGRRLYLRVPAATPIAACDSYTVQPGDTLSGIASRFDLNAAELTALNGLFDPNVIFPGQTLRLG